MAGISLAPADSVFAASPTWERIDTNYNVQGWTIDRGRANEMSRTGTGTATVELIDEAGDFDPTNSSGHFFGRMPGYGGSPMGPLVQAKIELQHPVSDAWSTLFRGFISRVVWVPHQTERFAYVTLELVDAMAIFAVLEMPPDFAVGHGGDFVDGNIVFNADENLNAVENRINHALDAAGWDTSLRSIFSGNVALQKTVYAPRSTVLQVLTDACDAEFPDIANLYISGPEHTVIIDEDSVPVLPGSVVFHGRYARFNAGDVSYGIEVFSCGDDAAADADPTNVVRVSPPLQASLDDTTLYTSALCTPQNVADGDIAAQYVQDATGVATKGLRTWSAENLATAGGDASPPPHEPSDPTTALVETKRFASYYIANFGLPQPRVGQLTIKGRRPSSPTGPKTWALLTQVDISDIVHLKTTHHGGGGFDTDFYVEGLHYTARPGGSFPIVELVLDVSPAGYYDFTP